MQSAETWQHRVLCLTVNNHYSETMHWCSLG